MPVPEQLIGTRVVADPAAIDRLHPGSGARLVRIAPDDVFVIGAAEIQVDDAHAIVEPECMFTGVWLDTSLVESWVATNADWHLPRELVDRPKQGFGFPLGVWMRTELAGFLRRLFTRSRFAEEGVFEPRCMQALLEEHLSGRADHNYRLWMVFNLEMFWRHYFDGTSVAGLEAWIAAERGSQSSADRAIQSMP